MKMYVGNLAWKVATEDLEALFSNYGSVQDAIVLTDRETGRSRGFGFVTMGDEDAKKARKFVEKRKIDYPVAIDDAEHPAWAAYRVKVVPTAFLIDPGGQIVAQWVGKWDHEDLETTVEARMAEFEAPQPSGDR